LDNQFTRFWAWTPFVNQPKETGACPGIMKQFDADTRSHAVESVRSHGYSIHLHETSL
jgi:hypothetical protein